MRHRRLWVIGTFFVSLLLTVMFAAADGGGFVHTESTAFLRVYNDRSRPLLNIVYDPLVTDWNAYQARELSYLVDALDARFIYACARLGMAHFYSLSAMVILLLCVAVQQYFLSRDFPRLPPYLCSLLSLSFVVAPSCRNFCFFRSAKPLTALAATVLCFSAWRLFLHRDRKGGDGVTWTLFAAGLYLAPLADRQGAFLSAIFAGMCGALIFCTAFEPVCDFFGLGAPALRKLRIAGVLSGGALVFGTVYNMFLAPALIRALNGYWPSFEYQNIGGGGVFNFQNGGLFLLDNLGFFLLHIYGATAFCGGIALLALWSIHWIRRSCFVPKQIPAALLFFAGVGAMLLCANLMAFRHQLMLRDDVIHGAYFMPMLAVLVFLAALTAETAASRGVNIAVTLLLGVSFASAAVESRFSRPGVEDHQIFFRTTSPLVIRAMNDPAFNADTELLPYSSLKLIHHFRQSAATSR